MFISLPPLGGNFVASVGKEANIEIGQKLIEKIGLLKQSIAGARQEIVAPVVWVGSQQINVMTLMLETLDVVKELAELTDAHTHYNTDMPENASTIRNTAYKSGWAETEVFACDWVNIVHLCKVLYAVP